MNRRLFISFSGGETSALMARLCFTEWREKWDEIVTLFANTGEENEETLEFVHECDRAFGFNTVWLEAVVHSADRVGTTHKVVNISTASRNGEPYEAHIQKYGIPNKNFPHCTRELKLRPMQSYLRSIGWEPRTYATAIGIRADESTRRSPSHLDNRVIYPLLDWQPTTKPQVNQFWMKQAFRLNLTGYQGNCKWCWKKSLRKLMTIIDETPSVLNFPDRMEEQYGLIGAEFEKTVRPGYRRVFFRGGLSAKDLRREHAKGEFTRVPDDALAIPRIDVEDASCSESCEPDFSDTPA